jgi:hypothetical protein
MLILMALFLLTFRSEIRVENARFRSKLINTYRSEWLRRGRMLLPETGMGLARANSLVLYHYHCSANRRG